jgi:hypothetical protein
LAAEKIVDLKAHARYTQRQTNEEEIQGLGLVVCNDWRDPTQRLRSGSVDEQIERLGMGAVRRRIGFPEFGAAFGAFV